MIVLAPQASEAFEGQEVLLQVWASGSALTYQWSRDGVPIPGATDSHHLTAPLRLADDGAVYRVAVSSSGSAPAVSDPAPLRVHPATDLRFRLVDAPLALETRIFLDLTVSWWFTYSGVTSLLTVGDGGCPVPPAPGDCYWYFAGDPYLRGFRSHLSASPADTLGEAWLSTLPPGGLVTSLDIQEGNGAFAAAVVESTQVGTFTPVLGSSAPADLAAAAAAEGAAGRVVTAISHRGGQVTWISHAWSEAPTARYQAQVATSALAGAADAARGLAAQGYVVTAVGSGNLGADGVVMVGTRREGDTAARELREEVLTAPPVTPPGFAPVALLSDGATGLTVLYQR